MLEEGAPRDAAVDLKQLADDAFPGRGRRDIQAGPVDLGPPELHGQFRVEAFPAIPLMAQPGFDRERRPAAFAQVAQGSAA